MICAICLELIICEGSILTCGHIFHNYCLYKWFHVRYQCVTCRKPILQTDDIMSIEHYFLTSEKGCILNGYHFFPKNLSDLKICLLYLFLKQHVILFHYIPLDIDTKLLFMLSIIIENNYERIQTPWTLHYHHFYKNNHFQIEYGSLHPKPININDIYSIYFLDGKNCRNLYKSIGYHGRQGILQCGSECTTIC